MKSNILATTAVLILMAAAFLFSSVGESFAQGTPTPQALGEKLVAGIKAKDRNALTALINPEVVAYMKKNDEAKLEETLQNWLNADVPQDHEFVVHSVKDIPDYNAASKTLTFGAVTMYFPVAPTDFLILVGEVEATVKEDGKDVVKKGKAPITIDAVMQDKGNWYVVLPVITKNQQPAQPQPQAQPQQ